MNRKYCNKPGGKRSQRLPDRNVRLVNAKHPALFRLLIMVGNYGIEHGVAETVK